jgi:hypothetical protein
VIYQFKRQEEGLSFTAKALQCLIICCATCFSFYLKPKHVAQHTLRHLKIVVLNYHSSSCLVNYVCWYRHLLLAGRSGDRISVEARFSSSFWQGLGAHPASYTMGAGSFPGVKGPGRGANHPPLSSAEVKERVDLYVYPPQGLHGLFYGEMLSISFE